MTTGQEPGAAALFDKFGTYILPGRVNDPRRGIDEAKEAERLGLGAVWISERFALKEPAVLAGAVSEATSKIRITGTRRICGDFIRAMKFRWPPRPRSPRRRKKLLSRAAMKALAGRRRSAWACGRGCTTVTTHL